MNSTCEHGHHPARALKPYPAYKNSSVEWLGKVPAHWDVERLKCSLINIVEQADEIPQVNTVVALENVESWTGRVALADSGLMFDSQLKRFRSGDVLFGKLRPYLAKVARLKSNGLCVGEFLVLRPRYGNVMGPYFEHLLRSKPIIDAVTASTYGAKMPRADWGFIGGMPVVRPPLAEQTAIVRFLDHADRRIRRYIQAKEKLIALLEEQKQAIIHGAITGRIDIRTGEPYGEYKASGVEWLDKVPTQWEVKKLHQCGTIVGGMTPSMENRRFWDGSIPWVTPKDMKRDTIDDSGVKVTEGALHETSLRLIDPPAVLMVVRGMILARRVPIAWSKSPVTINQDMKALLPGAGINAEFLARMLDSAQEAFAPLIDQAGHGTCRLPTERWRSLAVAIPPADEQRLMVDSLEASTRTIVAAIENAHRQTTLLDEYRTRLIADVVTGKLDVRAAAASLPEVDPLAAEGDSVDGVDHEAGSEHTVWRHAVEEGGSLEDVADA